MRSFGENLGQVIWRKRIASGLTQTQLAEDALGSAKRVRRISELESGSVQMPRSSTIDPIIAVLGISEEEVEACVPTAPVLVVMSPENQSISDKIVANISEKLPHLSPIEVEEVLSKKITEWLDTSRLSVGLDQASSNALDAAIANAIQGDISASEQQFNFVEERVFSGQVSQQLSLLSKVISRRGDTALDIHFDISGASECYWRAGYVHVGTDVAEALKEWGRGGKRLVEHGQAAGRSELEGSVAFIDRVQSFASSQGVEKSKITKVLNLSISASLFLTRYVSPMDALSSLEEMRTAILTDGAVETTKNYGVEGAVLMNSIALIEKELAKRKPRDQAIAHYENALKYSDRSLKAKGIEYGSEEWVAINTNAGLIHHIGATLLPQENQLAALERASAFLSDVVLACKENKERRHALAIAGNGLGLVNYRLGSVDGLNRGVSYLDAAVEGYNAALLASPRELHPHTWAAIMSNLGAVFLSKSDLEENSDLRLTQLGSAAEYFRQSSHVRKRENAEELWAGTQVNFCLCLLGAWVEDNAKALKRLHRAKRRLSDALVILKAGSSRYAFEVAEQTLQKIEKLIFCAKKDI